MKKKYHQYTTYSDVEDIKRLDFIVDSATNLNNTKIKILDVGCGNGNISIALGSLGFNVLGIDIDPTSIENAKSVNHFINVEFRVTDVNTFDINEKFDLIICSEVLEHLEDPKSFVLTLYSHIKENGALVVTVPNGYGPRELFVTKPMQWLSRNNFDRPLIKFKKILGYANATKQSSNPDLTHIQFFSSRSLNKLLREPGFKLIKWTNADFIERVFPYSFLTKRIPILQKIDCSVANLLPKELASGFYTFWKK